MENRLPPQNIEAEMSLLGAVMLDQEVWDEVSEIVQEKDFYKPVHRKVFSAIRELTKLGQPTDLVTISNYFMKTGELEQIGGPAYLTELMDTTPTTANSIAYAKIVHEKSLVREMIQDRKSTRLNSSHII